MFPDWTRSIERLAQVIQPAAPVAVFIDGDWLQAAARPRIDFRNLLNWLRDAFGADLTPTLQFTVRDRQGRDLAATLERLGYAVEAVTARKRHTGNSFDLTLALRAAAPSWSTLVLISGDSDFVPLLEHARREGRTTALIAFRGSVPQVLKAAVDLFVDLDAFMRGDMDLSPLMRGGQALGGRDQPSAP
jgi:NYN domain